MICLDLIAFRRYFRGVLKITYLQRDFLQKIFCNYNVYRHAITQTKRIIRQQCLQRLRILLKRRNCEKKRLFYEEC